MSLAVAVVQALAVAAGLCMVALGVWVLAADRWPGSGGGRAHHGDEDEDHHHPTPEVHEGDGDL